MVSIVARIKKIRRAIVKRMPDPIYYPYRYFQIYHRFGNLAQPKRYSEKIFHRMRHPLPVFTRLADKVAVRSYIADVAGERYLVPAFFTCDEVTRETFEALPDTFVMKANHSAGQTRIVLDKRAEDLDALAALANGWLKSDFWRRQREKHYRQIERKIIFEQALLTDAGEPPDDYKFNVLNPGGAEEPFVFVQYVHDRFKDMTQDFYLVDHTPAPFNFRGLKASGKPLPKVDGLDEMLRVAKKLAAPFGFLRVDFYFHEGRVYVGELTATPGAGMYALSPPHWDEMLGDKFGWPEACEQNI
jgi:hypothetical protein